jgi:hypothetical protein
MAAGVCDLTQKRRQSDLTKATATVPADVMRGAILMHDPLPPPDSIESYPVIRPVRPGAPSRPAGASNVRQRPTQPTRAPGRH